MVRIAVIGFGNHVKKNILPAFSRMNSVEIEAVYVLNTQKSSEDACKYGISLKDINESVSDDVDWVYISTPNSTHFDYSMQYLQDGKNVICEKPLTESAEQSEKLIEKANTLGLKLYEVCMYQYHKQFEHLKNMVRKNKGTIKSLSVKFSIPHLQKENIRYKKELGGGAFLDVGYYPISLILSLFGEPKKIELVCLSEDGSEVDLSGSAIFIYEDFYCIAEWGIGVSYVNEVTLFTQKASFRYPRIFSKPEDFETIVQVKEGTTYSEEVIGKDDQFVNMFKMFLNKKAQNGFVNYTDLKRQA